MTRSRFPLHSICQLAAGYTLRKRSISPTTCSGSSSHGRCPASGRRVTWRLAFRSENRAQLAQVLGLMKASRSPQRKSVGVATVPSALLT